MKLKPIRKEKQTVEIVEPQKFTDLKQVMDYTRPLTIFYSGVENESYLDILYDLGVRNFLMSYEYLKSKGVKQLKKYPDMHLFIDSGAYTYQNDPKYQDYTMEQWEKQIEEYLEWAKKHKESIFAIADLDLQYVVGYEQVYEWRKIYFEPFMLETGIPVCFIYHEDGLAYWDYMCQRYPYVGMSLAIDKVDGGTEQLREMFRIAEKHNSLCQGMASTNTRLLTEYPFYTVDSTTWLAGLKYGEISIWNGSKMSRIKKQDFEAKAFPVISNYDVKFNLDLIRSEDVTEMIRVNAYAFILAEKFVTERLKAKMYWLKSISVKHDIKNLPEDFYPTPEWFSSDLSDIKDYCVKFNINPEFSGAYSIIYDLVSIMKWYDEDYPVMRDEFLDNNGAIIDKMHDFFVNRIVPDLDTKIQDLQKFYLSCISGENDRLLHLGTNFDRTINDREDYIEEETEEFIDLSPEEVKERLYNLLPPPEEDGAPEIEALDEEIYRKADIIPTFDDKGKFVKGQVAVRKPKKVYSEKFPKFACDTCYAAARCPEFKAGFVCAYQKMFNRFDTRDMADIIQSVQGMVEHNMSRMQRAMVMEVINGTIDPQVTSFVDQNMRMMLMLKQMYEHGSAEVLKQTRIIRADGSSEESTQIVNPQSGGILEKLFSASMKDEERAPNPEPEELVEVKEGAKNSRYTEEEDF